MHVVLAYIDAMRAARVLHALDREHAAAIALRPGLALTTFLLLVMALALAVFEPH